MKKRDYTPKELYDILRKKVIGQEDYLKKLATCIWMHNRRIQAKEEFYQKDVLKQNLLVIGPSGSGKTYGAQILAELYGMDLLIVDMSSFTGTGWKGRDVRDMIKDLYHLCGSDKARTEKAIVFLDELDKACLQKDMDHDKSFAVEHALLKLIEGTQYIIEDVIDTENILFIGAGAFEGLDEIVKKRTAKKTIGFIRSEEETYEEETVTKEDLQEYGMSPQLLGRFADIAVLNELDEDDLSRILLESKSSVITKLDNTLKWSCGVRLSVDELGAKAAARLAYRKGTGARGLNQIITPLVNEALFDNDDRRLRKIIITKDGEMPMPKAELIKDESANEEDLKGGFKGLYSMPHLRRSSIEHFSWSILSFYLEAEPMPYTHMLAVHSLLCSIVYFDLKECNPDEQNIQTLQKLAATVKAPSSKGCVSVYEVLVNDEGSRIRGQREYLEYYRKYKSIDDSLSLAPVLEDALAYFCEHGNFSKGGVWGEKRKVKEKQGGAA